jgi:uncharacterized protein (TIGR02246 family)
MTAGKAFFGLTLLALLSFSCATTPSAQEDKAAVEAVSKARAAAFNAADAQGIAAYFTSDGRLLAPGKTVSIGRDQVAEYYQALFDQGPLILESWYEEVEVDGDLAYGRGEARVSSIDPTTGDTLRSSSKYLNILQRQSDGSWLTTHDIWNDN